MRAKHYAFLLAVGLAFAPWHEAQAQCVGCDPGIFQADQQAYEEATKELKDRTVALSKAYPGFNCASGGYTGQTYGANESAPCEQRQPVVAANATPVGASPIQPASFEAFQSAPGAPQYFVKATGQGIMACAVKSLNGEAVKQNAVYQPDQISPLQIQQVSFYSGLQDKSASQSAIQQVQMPSIPGMAGGSNPLAGMITSFLGKIGGVSLLGGQQGIMKNLCDIIPNKGACQSAMVGPMNAGGAALSTMGQTAANSIHGPNSIQRVQRQGNRSKPPTKVTDPQASSRCTEKSWFGKCQGS